MMTLELLMESGIVLIKTTCAEIFSRLDMKAVVIIYKAAALRPKTAKSDLMAFLRLTGNQELSVVYIAGL